jgi:hypothetical protein
MSTKRVLLIDGDTLAYQQSIIAEQPIDWGDGLWTLHAYSKEVIAAVESRIVNLVEDLQADEAVICLSDHNNFRQEVLPYYKEHRKKTRRPLCLGDIREHLIFNRKAVIYPRLEADDVIGSLVQHFGDDMMNPILILSADKDFIQLQQFLNVKQFDPIRKKYVSHNNPAQYTKEHILRGDSGDGVPNVLSPDNCFVLGTRQKPVTTKKLEQWLQMLPEAFGDENMLRNYKRNQQLIDLNYIPTEIKENIINQYETQSGKGRNKLFNYFVQFKLRNLMESIGEF